MTHRRYRQFLWLGTLVLMIVFALPHVFHALRTDGDGLLRIITTDDGYYHAHIKSALLGRFEETGNGITGGESVAKGSNASGIELALGALLSWTPLKAPQVMLLATILLTPLIFLILAELWRRITGSPRTALLGSAAFVFIFLNPLQKPVQMSLSLPLSALLLLALLILYQRPRLWLAVLTGIGFGLLPWVYFWSWTALWAMAGMLVMLHVCVCSPSPTKRGRSQMLLLALGIALLVSTPFLIDLALSSLHQPFFAETAARSTVVHTRSVGSLARFIVFTLLVLGSVAFARSVRRHGHDWIFPLACVLGMYIAQYQNVVHGIWISFASHYYPFLCIAAMTAFLWAWSVRSWHWSRFLVLTMAIIPLLAGVYDYRYRWSKLTAAYLPGLDHLRPAVELLDDGMREVVLTDLVSAHTVTSWTDDDVLFTAYVKHLFISDDEYARRYCLTEILNPNGPDLPWLAQEATEGSDPAALAARREQFATICAGVRNDLQQAIETFNVTKVLWNEQLRPQWEPAAWMTLREQGDGWSLWDVVP